MPELPDINFDEDVLTDTETRLKKPGLYKVVLHNDDYTTMEFVVFILQYVFKREESEAFSIMLKVHNEGVGVAGIYTFEIAQMKADKTKNLAQSRGYPLLCTIEEE